MPFLDDTLQPLVRQVAERLQTLGFKMACAESCTGGWLAKTATDLTGSSRWFERGLVTYSNDAKMELLGVRPQTLATRGAVSQETVLEMVTGLLVHTPAQVGVAITGIAGPGGASLDKPVGLVWFAWAREGREAVVRSVHFSGDREAIRGAAVRAGWEGLLEVLT